MANLTTAASSSMASSAPSTSYTRYDVFISHRGPDVKNTFASHLYRRLFSSGLTVFLDREELEEGHSISSQIKQAIHDASLHIAILSPRYAQSTWCLDELVLMQESGATILPVFYKVDPSVVRWTDKRGEYAEALQGLEQKTTRDSETGEEKPRYDSNTIQNWRNALSYVADLSGFVHGDEDDEGELLDNLVESVFKKALRPPLDVAKYPTALDLKFEEFEKTVLSQKQDEKRVEAKVVGIVGVGGVGKTTLAKEFFNTRRSDYNSSSFLFEVRENARTISDLQYRLLVDLKPESKEIKINSRDQGIEILKRHLSSCHALIILDDVDHMDQLEAFFPIKKVLRPDSLILVTSRDSHVLRISGVLESSIYTLQGMDTLHSKELFCRYAFDQTDPLPEFADLVDGFVKACGGLPLSLKVFGAHVCGENDRSFWQEILKELDKILPSEIFVRLKISYDSLSPQDKEIFLDIACFFLGEDGDQAIRIWGTVGVRNLQNKCLVELNEKNKIKMHDHIRDMGRQIAEERSMPRRLWHPTTYINDDLFQQSSPVITEVRGIKIFSSSFYVSQTNEMSNNVNFPGMRNLRLVATENGYLEGILSRVQLPHLIWLRWNRCPESSLPDWIPMRNLRVLEVTGNRLNTLWPQAPLKLRELKIWAPLSDIPKSIGQLRDLERIEIGQPWSAVPTLITRLPDEFCYLRSLKYLVFNSFSRMASLPDSFGELINLQHIDLNGATSLEMLPNSFGNLTRLKHLCLRGCTNLTISNGTLGNISMLKYLDLSNCKQVNALPPQVAHQRSLQTLYLQGTKLKELPSLIGDLCNLEVPNLSSDLLEALPRRLESLKILSFSYSPQLKFLLDSIGRVTQLTELKLERCGIEYLPQELFEMNNLESLIVSNCPLREHPFKKEIEGERERALNKLNSSNGRCMLRLKRLVLRRCTETRELFFDEGVCPNLQQLFLYDCYELRQIGWLCGRICAKVDDLPSLETLIVNRCEKLQSIQGLGQLTKLTELNVSECNGITELPGVQHLTSLKALNVGRCEKLQSIEGLCQLTQLRELHVHECRELQYLTSLETLNVSGCIQGLGKLTKLSQLNVRECHGITELPGLQHLTSLETLNVSRCEKLQSIGLGQLTQLRKLHLEECREIQELSGVEYLISLEKLNVSGCQKLQSIEGLGQLTQLRKLDVKECREIQELSGVEYLTFLETLNVSGCQKLQSIQGLGQLTKLRRLSVCKCHEISELPCMENLTSLEELDVNGCEKLQSIQGLGQLTKLEKLIVRKCHEIQKLQGVEYLISLQWLSVSGCDKLKSLHWLPHLKELQRLYVREWREIQELPEVEYLTSLETLNVSGCEKLKSIQGLGQLTKLKKLNISKCHEIRDMSHVENLTSLRMLNLSGCEKIEIISSLAHLTTLRELNVSECHGIRALPVVEYLTSLQKLNASGCEKIKSIQGLGQLTNLIELNVSECYGITELPGVEYLTSLQKLNASGCEKIESIQGLGQLTNLIELNVSECHGITELPGVEHLTSLKKLNISGCQKLQSIQGLGYVTMLKELNVSKCHEIELPRVENLTSLEMLNISGYEKLEIIPRLGKLITLKELNVSECHGIQELPALEHLTSLEKLNVSGCEKIKSIQGLGQLSKLTELNFSECHGITELPGVEHLTSLETLNGSGCQDLRSITGLEKLTKLKKLNVSKCHCIKELPSVENLTSLEMLNVGGCEKLEIIPKLGQLTMLRELNVSECHGIPELPTVEHLTSLEKLNVSGCENIKSIQGLGQLTKLIELNFTESQEITELSGVEHLTSLESLNVSGCQKLRSIQGLGQLTRLRELNVEKCLEIPELTGMENLTSLEKLNVNGCQKLKSIQGLRKLTKLRELDVRNCYEMQELPGVEHLTSMEILDACESPKLQWCDGVLEQLRQQLKEGLKYEKQRETSGNLCVVCLILIMVMVVLTVFAYTIT